MLLNFFRTAFRVLWKRRSFSFLNIMGLAVGIAASLLVFVVVHNEYSYDSYHRNKDRIYRLVTTQTNRSNGEINSQYSGVPGPLPEALRQDFPQLEKVAGIWNIGQAQIYVPGKNIEDEKRFKENEGLFWSEPSLFEIFDYKWLAGNGASLKDPNTVVLTESLARKYFGNSEAAMGQMIQLWSYRIPLTVVGVFRDHPANTDIPVKLAGSLLTLRKIASKIFDDPDAWDYWHGSFQCFVLAGKNKAVDNLEAQLPAFVGKYNKDDPAFKRHLDFQPLASIHLDKNFGTFTGDALSKKELWSLGLIGVFLLLVACINFINLSTAQSVNRAREIGVRKVLGSNRPQLLRQFLQETALITLISLVLGCLFAWAALPMLRTLMNKALSLDVLANPVILVYLLFIFVIVTLLAGIYPALVLSGFKPVEIFRNKIDLKITGGISLRRGLVVFQFVIAQLLIIGTIVVVKQMQYFRNQKMGFEKDGIILINLPSDSSLKVKYPMLKSRMEQVPGVVAASLCMNAPAEQWSYDVNFRYDYEERDKEFSITRQFADTGFLQTFGLTLVAGRMPFHSDSTQELIVNETLVKKLGLRSKEEILGKTLSFGSPLKYPVVGVVKDFNSKSLREAITPLVISSEYNAYEWIAVRMQRDRMKNTLADVRKLFTGIYPTYLYDQFFFDEHIERFYENEVITAQLFKIFAFLAIFISCLGLYGLVSFMTVQKTKEVGIRKVLGASVQSIVYLFSREFTLLIGLAFVISAPVGYYFMQDWLNGFYYHTGIGWSVFALAIIFSLVLSWIAVGYKAIRAALVNPVKSLKTE